MADAADIEVDDPAETPADDEAMAAEWEAMADEEGGEDSAPDRKSGGKES